jgi:acyl-CoA reductase-like NAD-dependent aldehyde dehydrogenase
MPPRRAGPPRPPAERANLLLKIADRIEQNLEKLAYAETWTTASRSARR